MDGQTANTEVLYPLLARPYVISSIWPEPAALQSQLSASRKRKRLPIDGAKAKHLGYIRPRESQRKAQDATASCQTGKTPSHISPVEYWARNETWPPSYSHPDFTISESLTRKRSSSNRSVDLQSSQGTVTDIPREVKSAPYKDPRCEHRLAAAGAYMDRPPHRISDACVKLCTQLVDTEQPVPKDSLFRDDVFETTCSSLRNENEAGILLDIIRLIVPSARHLAIFSVEKLNILIEKVNCSWLKCLPLIKTRPQPDFSVGFGMSAFSKNQVNKLRPFVGEYYDQCSVMAQEDMYFPFLTCEVKCGGEGLNIADRQNMHSASVAVKGIVELFRRLDRQRELHREILAFSVSHDNKNVRIYGHYPVIDGDNGSYYRHAIHKFDITARDGKDKWTAYKFTRNVYDIFVPKLLARLSSAIDQLPEHYVFNVQPNTSFVSQPDQDNHDNNSILPSSQGNTSIPDAQSTDPTSAPTFKKPTSQRRRFDR